MFGLTSLGAFHTAISLIAVGAGIVALGRVGRINTGTRAGLVYLGATVLTCLTGFPIMQHGGFGPPHILGVVVLGLLGVAFAAGRGRLGGRAAPYIETVGYSTTLFLHFIPAVTETATRLPLGQPFAASPEDPVIRIATVILFIAFVCGATWQVLRLRKDTASAWRP
jgi:hypothetical protein